MADAVEQLAKYLHLAAASGRRLRPDIRDRLLILAAVSATKSGLLRIAAYCRQEVLQHNPQHLLQRWPTVADGLRDAEFRHFLTHLEKRFSTEAVDSMMERMGIEQARERDAYYSDEEYAASLLGCSLEQLDQRFPSKPDA